MSATLATGHILLPCRHFAMRLAPWTTFVLVDEIRMTMEPVGFYRFISIRIRCVLSTVSSGKGGLLSKAVLDDGTTSVGTIMSFFVMGPIQE